MTNIISHDSEHLKNHPSLTHTTDIQKLCEPLHVIDITAFSHLRVFNDNQLTVLCNNALFLENYLQEKYYMADPCVNVKPESTDLGEYILWDSVPCTGQTAQMLADSSLFNFKHVFTIIKKQKNYVDFYHFGTHLSNPIIHQIYINNLEFLDGFITFFNSGTKKSKILSSAYDIVLNPDRGQTNIALNQNIFNKKIPWMKIENLTQKEIQCAKLLLLGKTSKEIAEEVNVSPRTIEDRIASLKIKLQAKNKADLIVKLLMNKAIF